MTKLANHTATIALLMMFLVSFAAADLSNSLETLGDTTQGLIDGGLEKRQQKTAEKILNAVADARAVPATDIVIRLKKAAKVVKLVEKGAKRGLDFGEFTATVVADAREEISEDRDSAEATSQILMDDRNVATVVKLIGKGDAARVKADAAGPTSKAVKRFAKAGKRYVKARTKAGEAFLAEVDSGLLALRLEETSVEEGVPLIPGEPIFLTFNFDVIVPEAVANMTLRPRGGGPGFDLIPVQDDPSMVESNAFGVGTVEPLPGGDYTLVMPGGDAEPPLSSVLGIPLRETVEVDFSVLPE